MALPIIEIIPKNDLYDYEAKYTEGGSEHIIPARLSDEMTQKVKEYAVKAHQSLGCETYSRADFILTKDNVPYILEVNTDRKSTRLNSSHVAISYAVFC